MKTEMTTYECAKALTHDEYASWTRSGAFALVEYLEQMEDEYETSIEFDRVALRCEYSEYDTAIEAAQAYTSEFTTEESALEYLENNTTVINHSNGILVQDF
tara:strand:+ start:43 stop:348 length:306 start_codon:yes stop_codon:yes gene_type:complete